MLISYLYGVLLLTQAGTYHKAQADFGLLAILLLSPQILELGVYPQLPGIFFYFVPKTPSFEYHVTTLCVSWTLHCYVKNFSKTTWNFFQFRVSNPGPCKSSPTLNPCTTSLGTRESMFLDSLLERTPWQWELIEEVANQESGTTFTHLLWTHLSFWSHPKYHHQMKKKYSARESLQKTLCVKSTTEYIKPNLLGISYPWGVILWGRALSSQCSPCHYSCVTIWMLV